jgi:hypothetical protein
MSLFKRKNVRAVSPKGLALAERVASRIIGKQTQIAKYLNRKTQYWNTTSKLLALLVFCLLFGGACLYLIIKSIY